MVMNIDRARLIVGVVGNVTNVLLFLSPSPTFYRIIKNKSVEKFSMWPYLWTALACMIWVMYGLPFVTPNSIHITIINGVGLVLECIYLIIYFINEPSYHSKALLVFCFILEVCVAIAVGLFAVIISSSTASVIVGYFAAPMCNWLVYYSPLIDVNHDITNTNRVEYRPFCLSLAIFLNGAVWTTYFALSLDVHGPSLLPLMTHGRGVVFGLILLMEYAHYRRSPIRIADCNSPA